MEQPERGTQRLAQLQRGTRGEIRRGSERGREESPSRLSIWLADSRPAARAPREQSFAFRAGEKGWGAARPLRQPPAEPRCARRSLAAAWGRVCLCPPRPGAEQPQKKGAPQGAGAAPGVLEVSQVFPGASRGKQLQESLAGLGLGPKLCCGTPRPPKKPPLSRAQPKKQSSQPPALQPGGNTPKPALHEGPGWHQQLQAELPAPGGAHGEPPSLLGEGLAAAPCASPAPQGRDEAGSSTGTPPWGLARGRKRTPPLTHGGGGGKWAGKKDKKERA